MENITAFKVTNVFYLEDGKTVFSGKFIAGFKTFGLYALKIDNAIAAEIIVSGEMLFPSKNIDEIAIYTYDQVPKYDFNSNITVILSLIRELTHQDNVNFL